MTQNESDIRWEETSQDFSIGTQDFVHVIAQAFSL